MKDSLKGGLKSGASFLIDQRELFYIALGFFTRLPVPDDLNFSQDKLNRASRYFPLVGWLIGLIIASVFIIANIWFSESISILLAMGTGFLITGAFHEDGLADTADGLGGGWSKQQKLDIMKDSRLGSYGAIALWFTLTFKFILLIEIETVWLALLVAHPLSRAVSSSFIYCLDYVSDANSSKVKPLAESHSVRDLLIAAGTGIAALLLVLPQAFSILIVLVTVAVFFAWFLKRQIGGFTGDTLGATQQISELAIYLAFVFSIPSVSTFSVSFMSNNL